MKLKIRLEDWNGTSVMQVLEAKGINIDDIGVVRLAFHGIGKTTAFDSKIGMIVDTIKEEFTEIAKEKGLLEEYTPELEFGVEVRKINSTNRWFYICEHEGV